MNLTSLYKKLPETPGVYLMKDQAGHLIYIGKAANLRRRVSSYFQKAHDSRLERLVSLIRKVDFKKTDTAIEALILEAELIKKYEPPFNIREKDDKSFLFVGISRDSFPRVCVVRGKDLKREGKKWRRVFGPFTSSSSLREALRIVRKIFPFSTHPSTSFPFDSTRGKQGKPCFDYQIGLCPGTCVGAVSRTEYTKTIRNLILFFEGHKQRVIKNLTREIKIASKQLEFETAQRFQRQIFALGHIQDVALIREEGLGDRVESGGQQYRVEGYDISNISGTAAVGSMVVFVNNRPTKEEYRKFRIKTVWGPNDVGMLTEVLERRFRRSSASALPSGGRRSGWPLPQLILIDGGAPQVNAARRVLRLLRLTIPVVGLVKGPERKRNDVIGFVPAGVALETLIKVRDEAHRFAISYHKKVRTRQFLS